MGKLIRSARGVMVDFDLMQIKKQIAAQPAPLEVKTRQDFIENRLRRRIKKAQNVVDESKEEVKPVLPEPAATVDESHIEDEPKEEVSEALAAVEETVVPVKEEKVVKKTTRKTTKQVARPKNTPRTEDKT